MSLIYCFSMILHSVKIAKVMKNGKVIAENGRFIGDGDASTVTIPEKLTNSVHLHEVSEKDLQLYIGGHKARVIEIVPEQAVTKPRIEEVATMDGYFIPDVERDLLKIAVIERHKRTGNVGVGIVKGLGLNLGGDRFHCSSRFA